MNQRITESTVTPQQERIKSGLKPLSAITYLLRNAHKTIPLTGVILLAVLLVSGIVAMMNSIPLSIRTIYSYSRHMLAITPRGDASQTPAIQKKLLKGSPVPIERIVLARASATEVRSIVGKWPYALTAIASTDLDFYLRKQGVTSLSGRKPEPGQPEAIISEPVARNLNLKLGSVLAGPENSSSYSPYEVKVVGIAMTSEWIMVADKQYHEANHFPSIDIVVAFAGNAKDQEELDRWAVQAFTGDRAQLYAYHQVEQDADEMFNILYKILNVVIGTLVLVITFMMGMLINIYQSQRLVEFGLLQAMGYTKRQLLKRVMLETATVLVLGWALGLAAAFGLLKLVESLLMHPNAFAIDTLDRVAYAYTLPIPLTILAVAGFTVSAKFRTFDPVSIVERRLV